MSGLELMIPFAICLRIVVLPAFGGDTTMPRWPLPIGATMSMIRSATDSGPFSRRKRSSGNSGVSLSKFGRARAASTSMPFTLSISSNAKYFSLSFGRRTRPATVSPLRSENRRTCDRET